MDKQSKQYIFSSLSERTQKLYMRLYDKYGPTILASADPEAYVDSLKINVIIKRQIMSALLYLTPPQFERHKLYKELLVKYRTIEREGEGHIPAVQAYDTIKPKRELKSTIDKIVYYLFTKQVPRRVQDYVEMYIWKKVGLPTDTTKNWYVSRKGIFIFNKYKTSGAYGQQTIPVHKDLQEVLLKHISLKTPVTNILAKREFDPVYKTGDKLFNMEQSGFSTKVKKLTGLTVNQLRHSYVTAWHKDNQNFSNKELVQFAGSMQHSPLTNLAYRTMDIVGKKTT